MVTTGGIGRLRHVSDAVRTAWDGISERGYAIVRDTDLGLDPDIRAHFSEFYFNDRVLEADHAEIHKDRDRARDVVRYVWHDHEVALHHTLCPGEMLLFSDERYLHDVTPLFAIGETPCQRDAIVCTVDYPGSYPL